MAVMMPSWKVTSFSDSGAPEPSTSRAFLMTVFLLFVLLMPLLPLTGFIVVLLGKWESLGVAAIALADWFARAFLPFSPEQNMSVRKQNRGPSIDLLLTVFRRTTGRSLQKT
jgi:hypothetical protein